jgi:hypothetical protein
MSKLSKIFDKDLLELNTLFGGVDTLLRVSNSDPEAKNKLEKKLKGEYSFRDDNREKHNFNFLIRNIYIDNYADETHRYFEVDLLVPGLDPKHYKIIAEWVDSYAEDMNGEIYVPSITTYTRGYAALRVKYLNGVDVDMPDTHFGSNMNVIKDYLIYPILSGINEEIVRIRKLFI